MKPHQRALISHMVEQAKTKEIVETKLKQKVVKRAQV
jgi:hypothetical protein